MIVYWGLNEGKIERGILARPENIEEDPANP